MKFGQCWYIFKCLDPYLIIYGSLLILLLWHVCVRVCVCVCMFADSITDQCAEWWTCFLYVDVLTVFTADAQALQDPASQLCNHHINQPEMPPYFHVLNHAYLIAESTLVIIFSTWIVGHPWWYVLYPIRPTCWRIVNLHIHTTWNAHTRARAGTHTHTHTNALAWCLAIWPTTSSAVCNRTNGLAHCKRSTP